MVFLQHAADYIRTGKAIKDLKASFGQTQANYHIRIKVRLRRDEPAQCGTDA